MKNKEIKFIWKKAEKNEKKGICYFNFTYYKFSLAKGNYGRWRGTISVLDREGKILCKKIDDKKEKKEKLSTEIYPKSGNKNVIEDAILRGVKRLYKNNVRLIEGERNRKHKPETIGLAEAIQKTGETFIAKMHQKANAQSQLKYFQRLKNAGAKITNKPMKDIKQSDLKKSFEGMSYERQCELYKFWQYCVDNRICLGENPLTEPRRKRKKKGSIKTRNYLIKKELDSLYEIIEKDCDGTSLGIALMIGGNLSDKEVCKLKWSDLYFSDEGYTSVYANQPDKNGMLRNYTRPLLPRTARMMERRYKKLQEEISLDALKNMPIVATFKAPKSACTIKAVNNRLAFLIKNALNKEKEYRGLIDRSLKGTTGNRIIRETYRYMLEKECNLENDPGTLKYLMRKSLHGDTTSDAYRDFTGQAAQKHLYDILKSQGQEEVEGGPSNIEKEPNTKLITAPKPGDNYQVIIEIELEKDEACEIECLHGVEGIIEVI